MRKLLLERPHGVVDSQMRIRETNAYFLLCIYVCTYPSVFPRFERIRALKSNSVILSKHQNPPIESRARHLTGACRKKFVRIICTMACWSFWFSSLMHILRVVRFWSTYMIIDIENLRCSNDTTLCSHKVRRKSSKKITMTIFASLRSSRRWWFFWRRNQKRGRIQITASLQSVNNRLIGWIAFVIVAHESVVVCDVSIWFLFVRLWTFKNNLACSNNRICNDDSPVLDQFMFSVNEIIHLSHAISFHQWTGFTTYSDGASFWKKCVEIKISELDHDINIDILQFPNISFSEDYRSSNIEICSSKFFRYQNDFSSLISQFIIRHSVKS